MTRNDLVALSHALSGAAAIIASVVAKGQIGIPAQPIKTIGFVTFSLGALLFAWSLFFLREAFAGNVEPVGVRLVTSGPYTFVRHPVYLAMLVMSLGLATGLRSVIGLAITLFAFFPAAIYRARLEERALEARYRQQWTAYRERTHFIIPLVY